MEIATLNGSDSGASTIEETPAARKPETAEEALRRVSRELTAKDGVLERTQGELYNVLEDVREAFLAEESVLRVLAETDDLRDAVNPLLATLGSAFEFDFAIWWEYDIAEACLVPTAAWQRDETEAHRLLDEIRAHRLDAGEGVAGRVLVEQRELLSEDGNVFASPQLAPLLEGAGLRSVCAFPVAVEGQPRVVIEMLRYRPLGPDHAIAPAVRIIGDRIGAFIECCELRKHYLSIAAILEGRIEESASRLPSQAKVVPLPRFRRAA
jgi:hypothetical protein